MEVCFRLKSLPNKALMQPTYVVYLIFYFPWLMMICRLADLQFPDTPFICKYWPILGFIHSLQMDLAIVFECINRWHELLRALLGQLVFMCLLSSTNLLV